jgi:hypothetical protein
LQGSTGPAGPQGVPGIAGPTGLQGPEGPQGLQGPAGEVGTLIGSFSTNPPTALPPDGAFPADWDQPGDSAYQATQGNGLLFEPTGHVWVYVTTVMDPAGWVDGGQIVGPPGPTGPQGVEGPTGQQGPQGVPGSPGTVGPEGPQGIQGPAGAAGPQGGQGPAGNDGIDGTIGPPGPIGPVGPPGPVQEAPTDSTLYGRYDAGWIGVPIQVDAPSDGNLYCRENGGWTPVPPPPPASTTLPLMDGTADIGVDLSYALADHVHPRDSTLMPIMGGTFTGGVAFPIGATFPGPANIQIGGGVFGDVLSTDGTGRLSWTTGGGVTISATAPATPFAGQLWWDTISAQLFVFYDEGSGGTAQWVIAVNNTGGPGPQGATGPPGIQGPIGPVGPQGPVGPVGPVPEAPTDGAAYLRSSSGWHSGGLLTGSLGIGAVTIPTSPPPLYDQAFIEELTIPSGNAIRFNAYVTPSGPTNIAYGDGTSAIIFTDVGGLEFNVGADASAGDPVPSFGVMTLDPGGNLTTGGWTATTGINTSSYGVGSSVIWAGGSIATTTGGTFWFNAPASNDAFFTFLIDGYYGVNFGWNANGNPYFGGWSAGANYYQIWSSRDFANPACDYRIKEDIAPLASTWDHIKALRPIRYRQKEFSFQPLPAPAQRSSTNIPLIEADDRERWGFIAHELQETLGETAATGSKDHPDRLQAPNLMALVAALTKTIQEMQARIETLEARA